MSLISIINQYYESSSSVTEQYKSNKRKFVNQLKKYFGKENIIVNSCPHFEFTGFIKNNNKLVYFSTGDLRWRASMLIRTANNEKDYTGGMNNFIDYRSDNFDNLFIEKVKNLTK